MIRSTRFARWRRRGRSAESEGGPERLLPALASAIRRDKFALAGFTVLAIMVIIAIFGPTIAPYGDTEIVRDSAGKVVVLASPSVAHPLGTTALGRDVLSQVLWGTRSVVIVGLLCSVIPTLFGFVLGLLAGYLRGGVDTAISRVVEIMYAIPSDPFAIVVITLMGPSLRSIIIGISLTYWKRFARTVRNHVLRLNQSSFIKAARVSGASTPWILWKHLAPLSLPLFFVYIPIQFSNAVLAESSLSFLGFGDPRRVSWGGIMRDGFENGALQHGWWWVVFPGLAITFTALSMFLVTRPLEEVVDPRLRSEEARI
jgi:peptide/nickel transport system permease protein